MAKSRWRLISKAKQKYETNGGSSAQSGARGRESKRQSTNMN